MAVDVKGYIKRTLLLGVELRPGELLGVMSMFASLFLILFTAYLLKPAREMLILTEGTAEIRSYAVALQALLLLFFIPIYSKFSRKFDSFQYMRVVTAICIATLLGFAAAGKAGLSVSVAYFVWLGAYSVLIISQFWAFASELYSREAGERIFVIVALGASLGAWIGSAVSRELVDYLDAYGLIFCGAFTLLLSSLPAKYATLSVPEASRSKQDSADKEPDASIFAGFKLVLSKPYLMLLAAFVIMLNLVNTTGEYLLASNLEYLYASGSASGEIIVDKGTYIGRFYGGFYFMVNLMGVLIQFFLVSRLMRHAGFAVAFALTPLVVFLGYSSLALLPLAAWFRYFKIAENSLDYSLQNTARQMLYLPLSRQEKYEARAVIDPFGQRIGDLLQAGIIFVGLNVLQMDSMSFIPVAATMAGINLIIAYNIIRARSRLLSVQASQAVDPSVQTV
ncbi:MAG: AAA family ATP:ADP antiporter [Alcanivorax sp.]|jgi:AAA family ATP:ADP antiporter